MPISKYYGGGGGLIFQLKISGYGFFLNVGGYDIDRDGVTILSWALFSKNIIWRSEYHGRTKYGYTYRCIKNGECVEELRFQSPIVSVR